MRSYPHYRCEVSTPGGRFSDLFVVGYGYYQRIDSLLTRRRDAFADGISKPQIVIHRDIDILFRAQIAFGGLDGGVTEQELDLLEIPAVLPAEFGAGAAEVVGAEVLDPDLLR